MKKNLEANIWKYAILLILNKRIFVAILAAYYLTIPDVGLDDIGIILSAGLIVSFLLEIPSGYVSDKLGHKRALVMSRIFLAISSFLFIISDSLSMLLIATFFFSAGVSFNSGTGDAFFHETLRGLGRDKEYSKVMGKISSLGFAVPILLSVTVPFFISISYSIPFIVSLVLDLISIGVALSLTTPPVTPQEIEEVRTTNFRAVMAEGLRRGFFPFALFSGVVIAVGFSFHGFRAPYQLALGVPVVWFGVFHGLGRALASLLLLYNGVIKKYTTVLSFYRFQLLYMTFLILCASFVENTWIVVSIFLIFNGIQWGLNAVDKGYMLERLGSSRFKATLMSTRSLFSSLIGGGLSLLVGFGIEYYSYSSAFFVLGIACFVSLLGIYLYIDRKLQKNPAPL